MSVKEHLYLLLLILKQEKLFGRAREGNLGSRRIFLSWRATKKLLAGRYLLTPGLEINFSFVIILIITDDLYTLL
jgi:hypothetical protein